MSAPLPTSMTGTGTFDPHGFDARHGVESVCLAPRNAGIAALIAYRTVVSPLYGDVCKYYPSCSAYALGAIQQHGLLVGTARAAARLARCHPWAKGGVDDVPPAKNFRHGLSPRGFVVPTSPRKD